MPAAPLEGTQIHGNYSYIVVAKKLLIGSSRLTILKEVVSPVFRSRKNKRRPDKVQAKAHAKAQVARFGRAALHLFSVMFIFAALTACGIALGRWA